MGDKDKEKTQSWLDMLLTSMSAAAFAEANEPEMAREILNTGVTNDAVLFVVQDGNLHQRAMQYAVNLCHRMDCDLAILHVLSSSLVPAIKTSPEEIPALEDFIDVPASLHSAKGELAKIVRRFLDDHHRIVSVVVDDATVGNNKNKRRPAKKRKWWKELNCPVVFIPAT